MPGADDDALAGAFVDTNLWVYAHLSAPGDPRHARALSLLGARGGWVISPQVVAEYYNVMLRHARGDDWIQANLHAMFARSRLQPMNADAVASALDVRARLGFSIWDCQIVAAALQAGCTVLLSEDLQHGQLVDGRLRVLNPFLAG